MDGLMMQSHSQMYVHPVTLDSEAWEEALQRYTYFFGYFTSEEMTVNSTEFEDTVGYVWIVQKCVCYINTYPCIIEMACKMPKFVIQLTQLIIIMIL